MANIYLCQAAVSCLSSLTIREPRERFVEYYRDLYALNQQTIDQGTFSHGDQCDYVKLGKSVLDTCQVDGGLDSMDVLICALWSHEFDPDYSSSGPYFSERYKIPCVFDVCDQGSLSTFMSLKIMMRYMQHGDAKRITILALEQNTIPRKWSDNIVCPSASGAGLLVFSKLSDHETKFSIIFADVLDEEIVLNAQFDVGILLVMKLTELRINFKNIKIVLKKSSLLYKIYLKNQSKHSGALINFSLQSYQNTIGLLPFMNYLSEMFSLNCSDAQCVVVFDEDVESLFVGMVIFEVKHDQL